MAEAAGAAEGAPAPLPTPAPAPHRLHYAGGLSLDAADSQVATDIPKLSALNTEQLGALVGVVVAFMKAPEASDLMESVDGFAAKYGVAQRALKGLVRSLLVFLKGSLKHGSSPAQLKADLVALRLPESHATAMSNHWRTNLVDLSLGALGSSLTVNELVDMEWSFGVSVASDELETVGATYLQIKFVVDQGGSHRTVSMELTLPQFYEVMSQLERASQYVDLLSAT